MEPQVVVLISDIHQQDIRKKELAFHGDVINTSVRIQSECNNYGVSILVSEQLMDDLGTIKEYTRKSLGSVLLKGKNEEVNIYTLLKT